MAEKKNKPRSEKGYVSPQAEALANEILAKKEKNKKTNKK